MRVEVTYSQSFEMVGSHEFRAVVARYRFEIFFAVCSAAQDFIESLNHAFHAFVSHLSHNFPARLPFCEGQKTVD